MRNLSLTRNYFLPMLLCVILLSCKHQKAPQLENSLFSYGGMVRGDTLTRVIHLTFTGGDYNDGNNWIDSVLTEKNVPAHFFFTGDFYRDSSNENVIKELIKKGHYLGPHSDKHLLYASWENRDSLLVTKEEFNSDLLTNYEVMEDFGIAKSDASLFMPPYEWYNQTISDWSAALKVKLINFSPGTRSNADYTTPDMGSKYVSSQEIYDSILDYESSSTNGLNGFILLLHIGTHPNRTDKFYYRLGTLIDELRLRSYTFELLKK